MSNSTAGASPPAGNRWAKPVRHQPVGFCVVSGWDDVVGRPADDAHTGFVMNRKAATLLLLQTGLVNIKTAEASFLTRVGLPCIGAVQSVAQ